MPKDGAVPVWHMPEVVPQQTGFVDSPTATVGRVIGIARHLSHTATRRPPDGRKPVKKYGRPAGVRVRQVPRGVRVRSEAVGAQAHAHGQALFEMHQMRDGVREPRSSRQAREDEALGQHGA